MALPQDHSDLDKIIDQLGRDIEQRRLEMPLLPDVAAEVLSSTLDDKANAARLAELIQQDQALATHLLRIVNSPAFRGSTEIVALQQALARLGMERIREIALSVSLQGTLYTPGPYDALLKVSWQCALRCALWSKEVARQARKNVEVAYLSGLLHNIGEPLLLNHLSKLPTPPDLDTVEEVLERLAGAAGTALVEEWSLPSSVALTIRYLAHFQEAKNAQDLVAVVASGLAFAQIDAEDFADEECELLSEMLCLESMQHLNFYPDDVEQLLSLNDQIELTVDSMR